MLSSAIDPFIAAYRSREHVRVALPDAWLTGAFTATVAVRLPELEGAPVVLPNYHGVFVDERGARIEIRDLTLLVAAESVCAGERSVVLLPRASLELADEQGRGRYRVDADGVVAGSLGGELIEDEGYPWLCLGAATQ